MHIISIKQNKYYPLSRKEVILLLSLIFLVFHHVVQGKKTEVDYYFSLFFSGVLVKWSEKKIETIQIVCSGEKNFC